MNYVLLHYSYCTILTCKRMGCWGALSIGAHGEMKLALTGAQLLSKHCCVLKIRDTRAIILSVKIQDLLQLQGSAWSCSGMQGTGLAFIRWSSVLVSGSKEKRRRKFAHAARHVQWGGRPSAAHSFFSLLALHHHL
jgi:ribosome-associated protein YbcJ (S4-like RNA binding protein)